MEWPLIGRAAILDRLVALLEQPDIVGIELVGEPGVGKSRIAREFTAAAASRGHATEWLVGATTLSEVPFGALSHLVAPPAAASDEFQRLVVLGSQLVARGTAAGPLVLVIDDAHMLDDRSAALVSSAAARGDVFVVLTRPTGFRARSALAELGKDARFVHVTVPALGVAATGRLIAAGLGGSVERMTQAALWLRSRGNPLYLRELILGALETGSLAYVGHEWRIVGRLAPSGRLTDFVQRRLGRLDPAERRLVEALAVDGTVELSALARLDHEGAIERLEDRNIVVVSRSGNREVVHLGHPIYEEVISASLPRTRRRRILRLLADQLEAVGWRREEDLLRLARWRLDGGGAVPAGLFVAAAGQAMAASDPRLAERFARAALASGPDDFHALLLLGRAMAADHRVDEADATLRRAESRARGDADIARAALARADLLYFRAGRGDEATGLLQAAAARVRDEDWRDEMDSLLVLFRARAGDLPGVAAAGRRVSSHPRARARTVAHTLMFSTIANTILGRFGEAEEQVRIGLESALTTRDELPLAAEMLQINRMLAAAYAGEIDRGLSLGEAGHLAAIEAGAVDAAAMWAMNLAECRTLAGDLERALATLLAALEVARARDPFSVRGIDAAFASLLCSWTGRREDARAYRQEIIDNDLVRDVRSRIQLDRATVWTTWADSGPEPAARLAIVAGDRATDDTHLVWAALIHHDAVRLGQPKVVRDRLGEIAEVVEGELVSTMARHAEALAAADGAGVELVAETFERLGCQLFAAEAMAAAQQVHLRDRATARARLAGARAAILAARCPGAATPPLATTAAVSLTPREIEIATLAAEGHPSREIGHRLGISVRTVDNHLGAVYAKLGASGRMDLASVFGVGSLARRRPSRRT